MPKRSSRSTARSAPGADEPRVLELFALPPAEFTAARNRLAAALAAEGDADEAARVRSLRRPPRPVWLLNALARDRPRDIAALLETGERLRKAQARAMRGDAEEWRAAAAEMHDAIATLMDAASVLASRHGIHANAAVLAEIDRALRAMATADESARAALRDGVLQELPSGGGVELLAGLAAVPPTEPKRRADEAAAARAREAARDRARADALRRKRRRAEAEARTAEHAVGPAEDRLRAAERALAEAERRVAVARRDLEARRAGARSARERAEAVGRVGGGDE